MGNYLNLLPYTDSNGLLCRKSTWGLDGGDSLHKTSHLLMYKTHPGYYAGLKLCEISSGCFVRNPDTTKWYSKPNTTSRDQLRALLSCLVVWHDKETIKRVFLNHSKRLLLFTSNTRNNGSYPTLEEYMSHYQEKSWDGYKWKLPDVTGPNVWALYIRGLRLKILWPLLFIFDLQRLVGAAIGIYSSDNDQANNLGEMLAAKVSMDTPVMWLARKISKRYLLARLTDYFTQIGEPPLHEYAAPHIKEL